MENQAKCSKTARENALELLDRFDFLVREIDGSREAHAMHSLHSAVPEVFALPGAMPMDGLERLCEYAKEVTATPEKLAEIGPEAVGAIKERIESNPKHVGMDYLIEALAQIGDANALKVLEAVESNRDVDEAMREKAMKAKNLARNLRIWITERDGRKESFVRQNAPKQQQNGQPLAKPLAQQKGKIGGG